jgi:hypothetical protein
MGEGGHTEEERVAAAAAVAGVIIARAQGARCTWSGAGVLLLGCAVHGTGVEDWWLWVWQLLVPAQPVQLLPVWGVLQALSGACVKGASERCSNSMLRPAARHGC